MEVRLPQDKLIKIKSLLQEFLRRKKVTLHELQSLIGVLNFACAVVVPGRTFLRRLINLTRGLKCQNHVCRLNKEAKADLKVWEIFCAQFNGKCIVLPSYWETSQTLHMYTDASNIGFGGYLGSKWFAQEWSQDWLQYHISVRELFPIVAALEVWGELLRNRKIHFHSDNMAVVYVINKKTSKDKFLKN